MVIQQAGLVRGNNGVVAVIHVTPAGPDPQFWQRRKNLSSIVITVKHNRRKCRQFFANT